MNRGQASSRRPPRNERRYSAADRAALASSLGKWFRDLGLADAASVYDLGPRLVGGGALWFE